MNIPRTTNNVEGWHRSFNESCVVANPNIAVVIGVMKDEEECNRIEILKMIDDGICPRTILKGGGNKIVAQNRAFITINSFLIRFLKFSNGTLNKFFRKSIFT